jgi:hypothetical protein
VTIVPKTAEGQLSPEVVLAEMTKNGVTHVVWLPDSFGTEGGSRR